jgi:hypothetical protein
VTSASGRDTQWSASAGGREPGISVDTANSVTAIWTSSRMPQQSRRTLDDLDDDRGHRGRHGDRHLMPPDWHDRRHLPVHHGPSTVARRPWPASRAPPRRRAPGAVRAHLRRPAPAQMGGWPRPAWPFGKRVRPLGPRCHLGLDDVHFPRRRASSTSSVHARTARPRCRSARRVPGRTPGTRP